ncbi:MAG: PilN domain-containing protein [Candidatus Omnitrophica bacterium]|nr:PilN domain-containing protein [Candidatus Omnitrophota bacterium]
MASNIRTVIEITDTHIKFLQAKKSQGKHLIIAFDACPIEGKADDEIEAAVLQMVQSHAINPENFILALPRRLASIKRLRLPSTNDKEIQNMLPIQIGRMMPHVLDDLIYRYEILEKEDAGYTQLIVYIVHRDVSDKYFKIFLRAKKAPSKFIPSSLGIVEWFHFQMSQKNIQEQSPVLLINFDLVHSEICFIHRSRLLYSRNIHKGVKDLRSDDFTDLFDQIELSIKLYRKERFGEEVGKIIVVSSVNLIPEISETLNKRFNLPVEFYSPAENVYSSGTPIVNQIKDCAGMSLSVCLGLGFSESKTPVNLIAKHVRDLKDARRQHKQIVQFICLFVLTLALSVAIAGIDPVFKTVALTKIKARVSSLNQNTSDAEEKINLVNGAEEYFNKRILIPDLMLKLYQATPPEISFHSLNVTREGDATIGGYAPSGTSVNSFQTRLVSSPDFADVSLQFTTKRRMYNQDVIDFKILLKLKRP